MPNHALTHNVFHKPVLVQEVLEHLAPQPNGLYIDATFGGGGHTKAILQANQQCTVVAFDWDKEAIERNSPALQKEFGNRFKIIWGSFAQLYKHLKREKITKVDGILADFGTSQFQIHQKTGFSFLTDTFLDMRMSPGHQRQTAADIINHASEQELLHILFTYGEEAQAKKIVRTICIARSQQPITTTGQLVELIESIIPAQVFKHRYGIHPATKTFQALRIAVNNELENIKSFLQATNGFLKPGGRIVCISFHSLEDRLVKNFFQEQYDQFKILTIKPVTASPEEIAENPSARSAKLRAAQRV